VPEADQKATFAVSSIRGTSLVSGEFKEVENGARLVVEGQAFSYNKQYNVFTQYKCTSSKHGCDGTAFLPNESKTGRCLGFTYNKEHQHSEFPNSHYKDGILKETIELIQICEVLKAVGVNLEELFNTGLIDPEIRMKAIKEFTIVSNCSTKTLRTILQRLLTTTRILTECMPIPIKALQMRLL